MAGVQNQSRKSVDNEADISQSLRIAESGTSMRKLHFRKIGAPMIVKLSSDHSNVSYSSESTLKCIPKKFKNVNVSEILEVRSGWNTDSFHKMSTKGSFVSKVQEDCCFSIIFRHSQNMQKSVDFITDSADVQHAWVVAVQYLLENIRKEALHFNEEKWLKLQFQKADVNKNGYLTFKEVFNMLNKLNLEISHNYAKQMFQKADFKKTTGKSSEQGLEFDEFLVFFRVLTKRTDLLSILRKHSSNNAVHFTPENLKNFIENEQKCPVTLEECAELIRQYEPADLNKKELIMTVQGFRKFLMSKEWGSIFNAEHDKVFQDMKLPMVNYFISSSHNTYLKGHQLVGNSTIEGYINTLQKGFRLLELDVWDGDDGPTITHGYTLVNPIRFRDVISAINQYAFSTTPYPVILSVENHCSHQQQVQMATILKDVLGDKLYVPAPSFSDFPSPEALKGKILVKGKTATYVAPTAVIHTSRSEENNNIDDNSDSDDKEESEIKGEIMEGKPQPKISLYYEMTRVTALPSAKLQKLVHDLGKHPYNGFASLSEKKTVKLIDEEFSDLVRYTSRHFVKIYPSGLRTDSSNYNPVPYWNIGAQCVCLNAQTADEAYDLNKGFFSLNGNCGYVLKPELLRNGTLSLLEFAKRNYQMSIHLRIISAQYLPKPVTAATSSDIIDPFVSVEIFGLPFDQQKRVTKVITNNGFNPVWDEDFDINLKAPEFALLRFSVKDYDKFSSNDFIGEYTIPVISLKQGYRTICLHKQETPKLLLSHLFVYVQIENFSGNNICYTHLHLHTAFDHESDPTATLFVRVSVEKHKINTVI